MPDTNLVVLAYSGGLDTSVICHWLAQKGYEVICCVVDVGQKEDIDAAREKALTSGAKDFVVKDAIEEFVREGGFQCLRAQARYQGEYLLGTAIARPFIMQKVIEVAHEHGAGAVAHGATGKGNDQVRFKFTADALDSSLKVIAPWSDPSPEFQEFRKFIPGRKEAIEYAKQYGIPVTATVDKSWSTDRNILHISHESGTLEDPYKTPPDEIFEIVTPPWIAQRTMSINMIMVDGKITYAHSDNYKDSEEVIIGFENGFPISVNLISYNCGVMNSVMMMNVLNALGGAHGIGIIDIVEDRFTGMKSRGVYEAPGMTLLYVAHLALAKLCLGGDDLEDMLRMAVDYGRMVYEGKWFTDRKKSMDARVEEWNKKITGKVRLRLGRGGLWVVGRSSPYSLYSEAIATMEAGGNYDQADAHGFMNVSGLPIRVQAERRKKLTP